MRGGPRSAGEGGADSILLWRGQAVMGVMGQLSCGACGTEGLRRVLQHPHVERLEQLEMPTDLTPCCYNDRRQCLHKSTGVSVSLTRRDGHEKPLLFFVPLT